MRIMIDEVAAILTEAAEVAILPRFRALADGDVVEKSPGELVTIADREAEELISARLRGIVDAPVVGEEAVAADPGLPAALRESPVAWLVDPLDGTANFVAGRDTFAVMAALVRGGRVVASWIALPVAGRSYADELGSGAWRDGERVVRAPAAADPAELRGAALSRFMEPAVRAHVEAVAPRFADLNGGAKAAGIEYSRLVDGEIDFVRYERTLPWDHAPGSLLLAEAGGVVRRLTGSEYLPADERRGLLAAADPASWDTVSAILAI
jgi:fructose-1,6-bisphosphatase/inositol monophosphatase family enzyme